MLSPEVAKERLKQWQVEEDEERNVGRIKSLPSELRRIGFGLLDRDVQGKDLVWDDWQERIKARERAVRPLDKLSARDRMKLFGAIFYDLAHAVESTWQLLKRFGYQNSSPRVAFRAANAEASLQYRVTWLDGMKDVVANLKPEALTPAWLAAWTPHLSHYAAGEFVGTLLAAVIEAGDEEADEVFDILCQSVLNEHEIGGMGAHAIRALLMASRLEGWELIEKTLIAAQRQEGLRQAILERIDEGHPEAFVRMLRLIRDNDLARFSAVVRAANVWFGLQWDSVSVKVVNNTIDRTITFLTDDMARRKALAGTDAADIFLALWSVALQNALDTIPIAAELLKHKKVEVRFAAVSHLCQLRLPQTQSLRTAALDDDDLRVAACAMEGWVPHGEDDEEAEPPEGGDGYFERLEQLFQRLPPKPTTLEPLVWPWTERKASREHVARHLVAALDKRPPAVLIPYLPSIKSYERMRVVQLLREQKKWDQVTRETLVRLAGDASNDVRAEACKSLAKVKLTAEEIAILEGFLTRKTSDLRQGIFALLLKQTDAAALASADRLTASRDAQQRLGGLEILRQLAEAKRGSDAYRKRAAKYRAAHTKLSKEEEVQLDALASAGTDQITLDNALGLMDPAQRSPAVAPKARKVQFFTPAALACLQSLDDLIHEHRETTVEYKGYSGMEKELLGNIQYGFPNPKWDVPKEKSTVVLPLANLWEKWYADRGKSLRDKDGLELLRAEQWLKITQRDWDWQRFQEWGKGSAERKKVLATISCGMQPQKLKYADLVKDIVDWMTYLHPPQGTVDFLLDAAETAAALVPEVEIRKLTEPRKTTMRSYLDEDRAWRGVDAFSMWIYWYKWRKTLGREQATRWWRLLHWLDEPLPGARRDRPDFSVLMAGYEHGVVTLADILDHILGPDRVERYGGLNFYTLASLTARKLDKEHEVFLAQHAEVRKAVECCRVRIVEIELARGETPTAATEPAWHLGSLWGTDLLVRLMSALGGKGLKVPVGWQKTGKESKVCTLTQLVSNTYPKPDENPDDFCRLVKEAIAGGKMTQQQVLELAFVAPQWAKQVEAYLGWNGFTEALYWFLAHMRYASEAADQAAVGAGVIDESEDLTETQDEDDMDGDEREKPSGWERLIAERTPLSDADRMAGAVDVGWFRRIYEQVTPKRWEAMAEVARLAANAAQARHAWFVAEVLTGKASRKQLIDGIRKKQLKDRVRLLGLYPLAGGAKRQQDLIERYNVLQDYRRYARGLSSMTKPEAMRSLDVGLQNLASTAGYADPLRLEWAMEAERVKKLAEGPLSVSKGGVKVTLALDADAHPQLTVEKAGKPLKSIPPALKKDKKVAELTAQATELKRQASLTRASLEAAMCRGDTFTAEELAQLCRHPILAPQLGRLVLVGDGILGYPDKLGKALRGPNGKLEPVKKGEQLRIAHPHDLLESKSWTDYQQECFRAERVQPFKQIFRELYVVTKQERSDGAQSSRYATQQIQPKQAMALWGQRGWHTQEGVEKTFYDVGLTVSVNFKFGAFTPLDVEGLTLDTVEFRRRDDYRPMKLVEVPPRIFSEAMRDIDLVVSVAHRGGVDPEASASTVGMRASLLRETCSLLGLKNVRVKASHAMVDGQLANYSVHLGSATVHRMPGGSICLVAVPAQHRGRLFLPFADDDPRTAEVLSKVILLARDAEIQDPTILEQIRA